MAREKWAKTWQEGQMSIIECTFCGRELFRRRTFEVLESPKGSAEKVGALFEGHMKECHEDEILDDLVRFWFA